MHFGMVFVESPVFAPSMIEVENRPSFWKNMIVYEAYPSVVAPESGEIGKKTYLEVLTENLQQGYYQDLHVGAIWLNPIYEDAGGGFDTFYDVADHKKISKKFGNMKQFDEMIQAAQDQGIHIVMDLVANHCSALDQDYVDAISEPDHEKQEMFLFYDDTPDHQPPSQQINAFGKNAWQRVLCGTGPNAKWKWVYTSFHEEGQRDYNWASPMVQEKFQDIIHFWRDRGVAGFRGDALPFIKEREPDPRDIVMMNGQHAMKHIKQIAQWIGRDGVLIPEGSMDDTVALLRKAAEQREEDKEKIIFETEDQIRNALQKMTYHDLENAFTCHISPIFFLPYFLDWNNAASIKLFHDTFYEWSANHPGESHAFQISDHDTGARGFSRLGSYLVARQAKMESYRAPMTVMYAGDENGQRDSKDVDLSVDLGRLRGRTAMDYGESQRQQKDPYSEWTFTTKLGEIKQNYPAYTQGKYERLDLEISSVYAYVLQHPDGDLLVVHTSATEGLGIDVNISALSENASVLLSNYVNREVFISGTTLSLWPTESVIIKLN